MQFQVVSYRNGQQVLDSAGAMAEIQDALAGITLSDLERRRTARQSQQERKAGIQAGLNAAIHETLVPPPHSWTPQVPIFPRDKETKKGFWSRTREPRRV